MFWLSKADWFVLRPVSCVLAGLLVVWGLAAMRRSPLRAGLMRVASGIALAAALLFTLYQYSPATNKSADVVRNLGPALSGIWSFRMETVIGALLLVCFALVGVVCTPVSTQRRAPDASILCAVLGAILAISAKHLLLAFVGLELLAVAALLSQTRPSTRVAIVSAFAAGLFAYGTALLQFGTGGMAVLGIEAVSRPGLRAPEGAALLGGGAILLALLLRLGTTSFPYVRMRNLRLDATATIHLVLSTTTVLLVGMAAAPRIPHELLHLLPVLAAVVVLGGEVAALRRGSLDQTLATLAIAQMGYMLVGFAALCLGAGPIDAGTAIRALLLFAASFGLAWLVLAITVARLRPAGSTGDTDLRGLARTHPWSALLLVIALLSLVGTPLSLGFWAKWQLLAATLQAGLPLLAGIAILATMIGIGSTFELIHAICFAPVPEGSPARPSTEGLATNATLALVGGLLLAIGAFPALIFDTLVHVRL